MPVQIKIMSVHTAWTKQKQMNEQKAHTKCVLELKLQEQLKPSIWVDMYNCKVSKKRNM